MIKDPTRRAILILIELELKNFIVLGNEKQKKMMIIDIMDSWPNLQNLTLILVFFVIIVYLKNI